MCEKQYYWEIFFMSLGTHRNSTRPATNIISTGIMPRYTCCVVLHTRENSAGPTTAEN